MSKGKSILPRHSRGIALTIAVTLMTLLILGATHRTAFAAEIRGTSGPDDLRGTRGYDLIIGRGGADTIRALKGYDEVRGRGGDDTIYMGGPDRYEGDDAIGGLGQDVIYGQRGGDQLRGARDNDVLRGGGGPDALLGEAGHDLVFGGPNPDNISGSAGNDMTRAGGGRDYYFGDDDPGRDWIYMGADRDHIEPIENDGSVDHIDCGRGHDRVNYVDGIDPLDELVDCERVIPDFD